MEKELHKSMNTEGLESLLGGGVTLGLIHFGPQYPSHMHNAFTLALSQSLFPLSVILKLAWDEVWVRHLGVIY